METNNFKRTLILGAHTDDGEIGMGGTIDKLTKDGNEVYYVTFSNCEISLPDGFYVKDILDDLNRATKILGIKEGNITNYDFPVRRFSEFRQNILDIMIKLRKELNPTCVFTHNSYDTHQDHKVIYDESVRAFKTVNMLGYELPWNNLTFDNRCMIKLSETNVKNKCDAIHEYRTQRHRPLLNEKYTKSVTIMRGGQINEEYGESFEVIRLKIM